MAWQEAISALRRHALPWLAGDGEALLRAEDLWQQSQVMIGRVAERARVCRTLMAQRQTATLRQVEQTLVTAIDMAGLLDVAAQGLPRLDIPSGYLSLYEDPKLPLDQSWLIMAYDKRGRTNLDAGMMRFPSRQLAPEGILRREERYSMCIEPLYFRETQLGFALLEMSPWQAEMGERLRTQLSSALKNVLLVQERERAREALEKSYASVEKQVEERTAQLKQEVSERERAQEENMRLQQEIIDAQHQALQELSSPIIPVMEGILVMPLVGSIDTMRARDITRALLGGIREHRAKVVILDITGVPIVDTGVANHLNKTIQAARLKGAMAIVTGMSDAVAETIVDLGIDWGGIETLSDLQTGLRSALARVGRHIE